MRNKFRLTQIPLDKLITGSRVVGLVTRFCLSGLEFAMIVNGGFRDFSVGESLVQSRLMGVSLWCSSSSLPSYELLYGKMEGVQYLRGITPIAMASLSEFQSKLDFK